MKLSKTFAYYYANHHELGKQLLDNREKDTADPNSKAYDMVAELLFSNGFVGAQVFLIKKTAIEIAEKINVKDELDFQYLEGIPPGDYVFIISETAFLKFFRVSSLISVLYLEYIPEIGSAKWHIYNFNISKDFRGQNREFSIKDSEIATLFIQLCVFWRFAELETIVLPEGRSNGTKKSGKTLNDTNFQVTIIDSTWNKIIIRTEGFDVDGHIRLQPFGPGRQDRKLKWINPYRKHGYVRRAGEDRN